MEIYIEEQPMEGVWIPESFIFDMTMNEETFEMTGFVWAEGAGGKLEQRAVTLGMYDNMTGCYEILSGLTEADYLADPGNPGCQAGAPVSRRTPEDFAGGTESGPAPEAEVPGEEIVFTVAPDGETAPLLGEEGMEGEIMLPGEPLPEGTEAAG
jgi:hypothetical protein